MKLAAPIQAIQPALKLPTGTPIVALDAEGKPLALGFHLSADPDKRSVELSEAKDAFHDKVQLFSKYARLTTTSFDSVAHFYPDGAGVLGIGSSAISFVSSTTGFADAVRSGDEHGMLIKGISVGIDAIDIAQKAGLLGQSATLSAAVLLAKQASAFADIAVKSND
jgi:hypothetical protein